MNATRLHNNTSYRDLDALDVAVLEAMLLQAIGPNSTAMTLRRGPGGALSVHLSPLGRSLLTEMASTLDQDDVDGWMGLLAPGLVEDAVVVCGEEWRAEAELMLEILCATRSDDVAQLARLAANGPLIVDTARPLASILYSCVTDPDNVYYM